MAPNHSNWPLHVCEVGVLILPQACANTLGLCPVAMGNSSGKRWVLYISLFRSLLKHTQPYLGYLFIQTCQWNDMN